MSANHRVRPTVPPHLNNETTLRPQSLASPSLVSPGNDQFTSAISSPYSVTQRRRQILSEILAPVENDDNSKINDHANSNSKEHISDHTQKIPMTRSSHEYTIPVLISPSSIKSHENPTHYSTDTDNDQPVPHQSMVLVERNPTMGHRTKPRHLVRKPSQKQTRNVHATPVVHDEFKITETANNEPVAKDVHSMHSTKVKTQNADGSGWWYILSRIMTFWAPIFILRKTIGDQNTIQAWREKISLCMIITFIGAFVAFLTLGLQPTLCPVSKDPSIQISQIRNRNIGPNTFIIQGELYDLSKLPGPAHSNFPAFYQLSETEHGAFNAFSGLDVTPLFLGADAQKNCGSVTKTQFSYDCLTPAFPKISYCHSAVVGSDTLNALKLGKVRYPWEELGGNLTVYNGLVLDLGPYFESNQKFLGDELLKELLSNAGRDASLKFSRDPELSNAALCLKTLYAVGFVDVDLPGCIISQIILSLALVVIIGVVMTRFFLAVGFHWVLSWRLGKLQATRAVFAKVYHPKSMMSFISNGGKDDEKEDQKSSLTDFKSLFGAQSKKIGLTQGPSLSDMMLPDNTLIPDELRPYYTVILVTCYSEGEAELKKTLDSVAVTTFPDEQKLLFIVADGIITGKGNTKSTPDVVLDLMSEVVVGPVEPVSYIAIADGSKRHNKARVHVGWYCCDGHRTPTILIVKSGNDSEQGLPKPGNRGKRDSQIILMDFFSKILLGDRICPLQFDMFYKIYALTGVHPLRYEIVLMCDADTKIMPNSLERMVACMAQDSSIMGLCGETRIENKTQTWVTAIQVFEYYISHHLGKAFESIFGGVTCLPGCFCVYRLKVERPDKLWVPIVCSPIIIEAYSENVVNTLHKKNLLSLGEDRYLSSLMLKSFPLRKMMFVPRAVCHTIVPHTFSMLLSQRRRWINSTIHNLLELVLVRQLCGTFCFSMQFVVFLELVGTVSLPVAITMTGWLVIQAFTENVQIIPLAMLLCILGLPAVLIMLTTKQVHYMLWMLVFLVSLPIWNFILPVYAFWHFDDFSWGSTRKVDGEHSQQDHGKREGEFDGSDVSFLTINEWLVHVRNYSIAQVQRSIQASHVRPLPSVPLPKTPKIRPF